MVDTLASSVINKLNRTIEDIGALDANGDETYFYGNLGEGDSTVFPASGGTRQSIPTPKAKRTYNAMELEFDRRFSGGWSVNSSYVLSRLYGNYSGVAASEEVRPPTVGVTSPSVGDSGGTIVRQAGNVNRAYDIDELLFDSKGNLDVQGRLPTDRPHQFKIYAAKDLNWGTGRMGRTTISPLWSIASGTPMTTYVTSTNQTELMVNGRGDMGRTPLLSRTDVNVNHQFSITETKKLSFEFNMENLFNQKSVRYLYNYYNRGGGGAVRATSFINLATTDLFKGYDYQALVANTADGRAAVGAKDPRYGMDAIWSPGFRGRFGVKFTF